MKIRKKSLCAMLVAALLTFSACTGPVATSSAPPADKPAKEETTSTAEESKPAEESTADAGNAVGSTGAGTREAQPIPEGDWKTPYPTMVNIRTAKVAGLDQVFDNGDDQTNNPWTRAWKDELGIEVVYDWVDTDQATYDTKLNMAIASNTMPDSFKCNYVQYRQLMQAGLIMDLTDLYNNNVSQRIRDYEKTDPDTIKLSTKDGKIYGIPGYYYGTIDQPKDLWVRKDWYEAAGKPELKTVEQFETLAKKFVEEHGGYGLAISNTLDELFMTGPMFDVYLGTPSGGNYFWYKDDTGRIKAGITHPEMKDALTAWARWFQDGIISPDFANLDADKMNEDVVNGKAGFQPYYQWAGWLNGPNLVAAQSSNDAYMIPMPFPTVDGGQVMGQVGFPNGSVIVINKECTNPAAVMKLISYTDYAMFDPTTKLTEEQFKGFTDGQREHVPGSFEIIDPSADMIQFENVLAALKSGDTSNLYTSGMKKKYGDSKNWIDKQDPGGLGAYCQQGFDGCSYDNSKFLLDNNFTVKTDMWGPPPEEFDQTVNTIDIALHGITEIIMGTQPVDYYDTVLKQWYDGGGTILEDAVNANYGKK